MNYCCLSIFRLLLLLLSAFHFIPIFLYVSTYILPIYLTPYLPPIYATPYILPAYDTPTYLIYVTPYLLHICVTPYLHCLASIKRLPTNIVTATFVSAFVLSGLNYCNSLLLGSTHDVTSHLQRIQNSAARVILRILKSTNIAPHF